MNDNIILEWTTRLDTSSRTLFVRDNVCRDVHVISRQIVERRVTSDCYLNIVVSLDC